MVLDQLWLMIICIAAFVGVVGGLTYFWVARIRKETKNYANLRRFTSTPGYQSVFKKYRRMVSAALILLIVALMCNLFVVGKPVTVIKDKPVKYNRDIVLCLDVSGSMLPVDDTVLTKFNDLIKGFKGERLSLVIFNSTSNQVFPLTDDYSYIKGQLKNVQDGVRGNFVNGYNFISYTVQGKGGSSLIGDGLTACSLSFDSGDSNEHRSRSVILATDNIVNGQELVPLQNAAKYAKSKNIKVYGIDPDPNTNSAQANAFKQAVKTTNGKFYSLGDPKAAEGIINQIDAEQTSAMQGDAVIIKTDNPQLWIWGLGIAFLLFLGVAWRAKI